MPKIYGAETTSALDLPVSPPASRLRVLLLWISAVLGLTALLITFPRSPLPWFDEIFMESTALSIVRGNGAIPSVLGAFSGIKSLNLFLGPVALALGAADVKLFGVSLIAWRSLGWLGVAGMTLLASWVAQRLAGGTAAAATAVLVAFSQGVGRAVSGRLDSIAVSLEIASLGCAIVSLQSSNKRAFAMLSGLFCCLAILSTPRSFPFALSLFVAFGAEILFNREHRRKILSDTVVVAAVIGALVVAWTAFENTNPLGWLRFVLSVSHSDPGNVSPLLGGKWHLLDGPVLELANGFGFLLVLLVVIVLARSSSLFRSTAESDDSPTGLRFALVAALTNYCLTFGLISRFWDYDIFVVPLLLPATVALTWNALGVKKVRSYRRAALIGAWIIWAGICLAVRGGKLLVWANSYQRSDGAPLTRFVAQHVPQGSVVFGPLHDYFYAVENSGSRFLYPRPWIAPGFSRDVANVRPSWNEMVRAGPVYLIWPAGSPVPEELTPDCLESVGRFQPEQSRSVWHLPEIAAGEGYPPTVIYRVIRGPQ